MHCDTHPWSASRTAAYFTRDRPDLASARTIYLTGWRNITANPVRDNHLALCDERSLVKVLGRSEPK